MKSKRKHVQITIQSNLNFQTCSVQFRSMRCSTALLKFLECKFHFNQHSLSRWERFPIELGILPLNLLDCAVLQTAYKVNIGLVTEF